MEYGMNRVQELVILGIFFAGTVITLQGQGPEQRSFRVLSFAVDGKETTDYSVWFRIDKDLIKAVRNGDQVLVPQKKGANKMSVEFRVLTHRVVISDVESIGYLESDKIKEDLKIEIDTPPFSDPRLVRRLSKHKVCAVHSVTGVPTITPKSRLIADPVKFTFVILCETNG
jgi:hypothetical protein